MPVTKYADVITRIAVADKMVRMDLATIALESVTEDGQARLEVEERLCLPLNGFLRTYQEMSQLIANLKAQGILKSAEPNSGDTSVVGTENVAGADVGDAQGADGKKDKKGKKS